MITVSSDDRHRFSKIPTAVIALVEGFGVVGDAHAGETVQHRSRVAKDPGQPNLRQVHLIHSELFDDLHGQGFDVHPAELGENITTVGVDLLALPRGTRLRIGATAEVEVTGLRNPCSQIDDFMPGLLKAVAHRAADGSVVRRTGIMGIVAVSGEVSSGDPIRVDLPSQPHEPLAPV